MQGQNNSTQDEIIKLKHIGDSKSFEILQRKLTPYEHEIIKLKHKNCKITSNRTKLLEIVELYTTKHTESSEIKNKSGIIEHAFRKIPNNKVPGDGDIVAEAIKICVKNVLNNIKTYSLRFKLFLYL